MYDRRLEAISAAAELGSFSRAAAKLRVSTPALVKRVSGFEVTPNGNSVDIEEQMVKSGANQVDFQAVSSLYERSLMLLKKAVGKS